MKIKILTLLLLGGMLLPNCISAEEIYTNANGIKMSINDINNLKDAGFNEEEIEIMDENLYLEFNTEDYQIISSTKKYIKTTIYFDGEIENPNSKPIHEINEEVSEEEYNSATESIQSRGICGSVSTTYKLLTSDIVRDSANNRYNYKATLTWKKMPKVRKYDIIGIGIDGDVSVVGSATTFRNSVKYSDGSTAYKSSATETRISSTGIAKYFKLYEDTSSKTVSSMVITMIAPVIKRTDSKIKVLNNYADYSHCVKAVAFDTLDVGVSAFGISFGGSASVPEYDSMSTAQAIADGLNW